MNLKDFTIQSFDVYPAITSLRDHFHNTDKSIFLTPDYTVSSSPDKIKKLTSNFIKLFHTAKEKFPEQFSDLILLLDNITPLGPHWLSYSGFYPPLKLLASEEQLPKWEKLVLEGRLVGAYAQTEISHGSDVQSLQTTATYNQEKKCFIMNSPNIGSYKFWVGVLGMHATHAILQAQTYVNGKYYGLQTFVVPLRDPKTYKLYEGVEAGDIGVKLGLGIMDNGYLRMKDYEIPRENLLMRFFKVEEDGTVKTAGDQNTVKIGYGGMLGLRVQLLRLFLKDLYKALTIWTHSCIKEGNMGILQKRKILQEFASIYCGLLTINGTNKLYMTLMMNIKIDHKKALRELEELHLIAAGFKPYFAWGVLAQMRRYCGLNSLANLQVAGLALAYADKVPAPTYEGDNLVMLQQTARGLCKYMKFVELGKPERIPSSFRFLWELREELKTQGKIFEKGKELTELDNIERLINVISYFNVNRNYRKLEESLKSGKSDKVMWNEKLQGSMIKMALGVMRGFAFKMAKKELLTGELSAKLREKDTEILKDLLRIYGLDILLQDFELACQFEIGIRAEDYEQTVKEAQEIIFKRLEGQLEYIMGNSCFKEEEVNFVRDYKGWETKKYQEIENNLKGYADQIQKNFNSYSKL